MKKPKKRLQKERTSVPRPVFLIRFKHTTCGALVGAILHLIGYERRDVANRCDGSRRDASRFLTANEKTVFRPSGRRLTCCP